MRGPGGEGSTIREETLAAQGEKRAGGGRKITREAVQGLPLIGVWRDFMPKDGRFCF